MMQTALLSAIPQSDVDLYRDDILLDPYATYQTLRNAGPLVWLSRLNMYVASRYSVVKEILATPSVFISGKGVMMNERINTALQGIGLCSDGVEHDKIRRIEIKPLMPRELRSLKDTISSEAESIADRLVAARHFDAATDLAQHLPLSIVSNLVGLPEDGRERMLEWAAANFNCFGPLNERAIGSFDLFQEMVNYALEYAVRGKLKPGSWAEMLHDAADRGEIPKEQASLMALSYVGPSLDTTIFAISSAIWLFANNPDQWDLIREDSTLIPNAISEVIRMESPIQGFSRFAVQEHSFDDMTIPRDSRVIVLYGSANRDERRWVDPGQFDVRREGVSGQLAFGHGEHSCIGINLARMEMAALLTALTKRVKRFEIRSSERVINNTLRGFKKLDVVVH
ncbi:cytochrome P450 [Bradyrhizobium sp. USDA 3256]